MSQGNLKDALIDSVMGDDHFKDAYYEEQDDVTIEDGTYPAIVVDMTMQKILTKKNVHADLYKPKYQIAKGNYKGKYIIDKGIWRFRSEPSSMHNKSNRGNIAYKNILDIFSIPLESVEVNGRQLKRLPELTLEKISGKSVLIDITDDNYRSNYGRVYGGKVAILHSTWNNDSTSSEESKPE